MTLHKMPDSIPRRFARLRPGRRSCLVGRLAGLACLLALSIATPGCGNPELRAQWRDREIAIDGDFHDWDGRLFQFEEQKIYAGVLEDESHLYLCLSTSDRSRMWQVVRGGLTLWFDPTNDEKRSFGLRFPVGGAPMPPEGTPPDSLPPKPPRDGAPPASGPEGGTAGRIDSGDIRKAIARFTTPDRQIEIHRDGAVPVRLFLAEASGIDAQIGYADDVFTYELKVPKQAKPEFSYTIAMEAGRPLLVGLETAALAPGSGRGQGPGQGGRGPGGGDTDGGPGGGGMPPGGSGGGRGGRGPGGGGPGGGPPGGMSGGGYTRSGDRPADSPLRLWIRVNPLEDDEK